MHSRTLLRSLTSRIMLIGVMIFLLLFLPSNSELNNVAVTANKASDSALKQAKLLQDGIEDFQQTDIQTSIDNAGLQAKTIAELLKGQAIDIETVQTLHDAFGDLAVGLETTGEFIDPESAMALATSLDNTATFLETSVAKNALEIAGQVEKVAQSFSSNAKRLNQFLETKPFNLNAIEQLRDTLNSYSKAIDSINQYQLSTADFNGIAKSLKLVSNQIHYYGTFQVAKLPFNWGGIDVVRGDAQKAALNAAKSLATIAEKTEQLGRQLPKIRAAVSDSKKTVDAAKMMLDNALKQRETIAPILSELPEQFVFLSEEFPKLALNFTSLMRETSKINQAAAILRETSMRTRKAAEELPKIRSAISRGARLLSNSQQQLNHVINNREKYDAALGQTVVTLEGLSVAIPATKSQIDQRLQEQKLILDSFVVTAKTTSNMIASYQASLMNRLNLIRMLLYTAIVITLGSCVVCFRNPSTVEANHS
ncbi:MAG: hypothetical protein GY748_04925 [Planctomycetaceae bacterium]|nr:hypothetical protein [Planctomycetaceae bacterium]